MLSEISLRHSNFLFRLYATYSRKERGKRISSGEILINNGGEKQARVFEHYGVTWKETKSSSANEITFLPVSCLLVDIRPSSERLEGHSWTQQWQEPSWSGLMVGLCPAKGLRLFGVCIFVYLVFRLKSWQMEWKDTIFGINLCKDVCSTAWFVSWFKARERIVIVPRGEKHPPCWMF